MKFRRVLQWISKREFSVFRNSLIHNYLIELNNLKMQEVNDEQLSPQQ
jgi:hypothetical protein